jgi:hypothetical protein
MRSKLRNLFKKLLNNVRYEKKEKLFARKSSLLLTRRTVISLLVRAVSSSSYVLALILILIFRHFTGARIKRLVLGIILFLTPACVWKENKDIYSLFFHEF